MAKTAKKTKAATKMPVTKKVTAREFIQRLKEHQSDDELKKIVRYFKSNDEYSKGDKFIGVRMGQVFALAKEFIALELEEVEKLLQHTIHEVRVGGVSILDFQARQKKLPEEKRKALFDLYIKCHDRINNWDLVDRSAPYVVGGYLYDKPRDILYKLARSKNMWERRTAIVSTYFFIRQGDVEDTFRIAEILLKDKEDLINKATGSWLRAAGTKSPEQLITFLDKHSATMSRVTLRYAIEHLSKKQREQYLK